MREALVRLFSTILRKDDDGFMLVTPHEKLAIAVEDAPFIAVLLDVAGVGPTQRLRFTTNVGDSIVADAAHPLRFVLRDGAPVPYVEVRRGLEARLCRAVYYQLADLGEMRDGAAGVWSGGVFFAFESA